MGRPDITNSKLQPVASAAAWQRILLALPNAHALQSWTWGAFKSRWGWSARPLWLPAADGSPAAAALVLKRKLPRLPFAILYVPKGPCLDYTDASRRQAMLTELAHLARQENAIFIKIDPDVPVSRGLEPETPAPAGQQFLAELQQSGWRFSASQIQFRNTVELDLTPSEEELLAAMKQKTRYNVRLAERKDVIVREGGLADLPLLAQMYIATAARDGFTVRLPAYYLDAWSSFLQDGLGHLLIAEYDQRPLAAVFLVKYGQRAIYMYGASSEIERQRMPNYLLQWEAVRWARAQGCTVYDFWGAPDEFVESDPLWGVWRFKAGYNGEIVRHVGAWDYPVRPFGYWLYTTVIPQYIGFLRGSAKANRGNVADGIS